MKQPFTLRSKNRGKRWGIWDRAKKAWFYKPQFQDGLKGKDLRPLDTQASEVAKLLPQIQPPKKEDKKKADVRKQSTEERDKKEVPETNTEGNGSNGATRATTGEGKGGVVQSDPKAEPPGKAMEPRQSEQKPEGSV
jgi:hypothetical protein